MCVDQKNDIFFVISRFSNLTNGDFRCIFITREVIIGTFKNGISGKIDLVIIHRPYENHADNRYF